jgi:lysophospholipase L1-like esterase
LSATSQNPTGPRTLVIGDSWVRGLSKGQGSISRLIPEGIEAGNVLDISKISRVITDVAADHLREIDEFAPEFALVAIGGADSLVFPARWIQRLIDRLAPPKWQGVEGLMPSAMIYRDRKKRIRQRIEKFGKTLIKQLLVTLSGGRRRVPLPAFEAATRQVLDLLEKHGTIVVLVGCTDVDPLTFPKSNRNIHAAQAVLRELSGEYPFAMYADSAGLVDKWDDYLIDRVHLTRDGHRKVADGVLALMAAAGEPWRQFVERPQLAGSRPALHLAG